MKDPSDFVFRADDPQNRIPSARQLVYNDRRANPRGRLPDDTWIIRPENAAGELTADEEERVLPEDPNRTWTLRPQDLEGCFRADEDTWYFPRVAGTFRERAGFHGCQMPEQLLGRIIRTCSEPGALVVDPFSGSATTLAVAKKLGRRFLGFELSADYVRLGMERLDAIDVGDPLVGSPEPTASAPKTFSRGRSRRSPKKSESPEANGAGEGNGSSGVALTEPEFARATEAVVEAFRRTHKGYSADRVVVDPELNERYADACRSLGVPGTVRQWNMLLFRQRKAGRLIDVPTTRTTSLSWKECDRFLFASEIAWEMVLQTEGVTGLDEILCDPRLATRFDSVAQQFAPGHTLFEYRWAALKLRKQARVAVQRSRHLQSDPSIASTPAVAAGEWARVPEAPGVYVITAGSEVPVYCGETRDLRSRIRLIASQLSNWSDAAAEYGVRSGELAVQTGEVNVAARQSLVHQCSLIRKLGSTLNVRQLWGT